MEKNLANHKCLLQSHDQVPVLIGFESICCSKKENSSLQCLKKILIEIYSGGERTEECSGQRFVLLYMMAKSSSTRQRERKKSSPSTYFKESKFDNSSKTLNADLSPTLGKTSQNLRNRWLWRCFIFTFLMLTGIISLYFDNNSKFFPRTWSSILADLSGTPKRDAEVPCSVMDNSTVDHRSNLTLAEFIRCYDAKRYSSFDQCKLDGKNLRPKLDYQ